MGAIGWEERLARHIEETNERIADLNAALPSDAGELYTVPTNPTPSHVDRMRSDLDALVTDRVAPGTDGAADIESLYDAVMSGLDDVHAEVSRHSIPKAPNYEDR